MHDTWQIDLMNKVRLQMAETRTMQALAPGENPEAFLRVTPEQNLLRWFNFHLRRAGSNRVVTNFGPDLRVRVDACGKGEKGRGESVRQRADHHTQDGEAYTLLLAAIAPGACNREPLKEPDLLRRAELMLQGADRIGCRKFVQAEDVVAGNPKLNLAFTAHLFTQHPGLQDIGAEPEPAAFVVCADCFFSPHADAQEAALRAEEQRRAAEQARVKAEADAARAWAEAKAAEEVSKLLT